MSEVRVHAEGTLWYVQASGTGRTWTTGATPVSGLLGYVDGFQYTSAQTIQTITERGIPDHHKVTMKAPIDVSFNFMWTGGTPSAASGSGATVPMWHLEFRASAAEIGNGSTGFYHQFMGVASESIAFTENPDGDKIAAKMRALAMVGPTGSGYIK